MVETSFELFWVDPASCANCFRSLLERVPEDIYVPEGSPGSKWSLSERTDYFRNSVSAIDEKDRHLISPIFKTLKKLGDLGSHAGEVSREELLNAFEDLEIALALNYGKGNEPAVARIKAGLKAAIRRDRHTR